MNTQSEKPKFFSTKTDPQKNTENSNALRMNRSVQSTNHTNDNRTTITINETSPKTFFLIFNQKHAANQLYSRDIIQGRCHAIEFFIDYEHRCLSPWKLHCCSLKEFYFEL